MRVLSIILILCSRTLIWGQPPLMDNSICSHFTEFPITEFLHINPSTYNDTILLCSLLKYLENKEKSNIQEVNKFVNQKASKCLTEGFFTNAKAYRSIQAHLAKEMKNDSIYMESIYQYSLASYRMGQLIDASKYNIEGKAIAIRDSLHMRHISFLYRESWIYWQMSRYKEAIESIEECKRVSQIYSPHEGYYFTYHDALASFNHSMKNHEIARFHADSAIFHAEKMCYTRALAIAKANRAIVYHPTDTSDFDFRIQLVNEALAVSKIQSDREQIGINYNLLGKLNLLIKDYHKAIAMFDSSFYFTQITNDKFRELECYEGWSEAHKALNNYHRAFEYKQQELALHKELYGAQKISKVIDFEKEAIEKQKVFELEKLHYASNVKTLKLKNEKATIAFGLIATILLSTLTIFWFYRRKKKQEIELILSKQDATERINELKKKALRAQMNPHFIFNSLNSIKSYIAKNEPRTATRFLNKFAQLMRIILSNSDAQLISLTQEINSLKLYTELEQFRLNNDFEFELINNIETDMEKYFIPPLIIQPYVENAIWHGLVPKVGDKNLIITINLFDDKLKITIDDNGIGRVNSKIKNKTRKKLHKSMGMKITQERIGLHNENQQDITLNIIDKVDSDGNSTGTTVNILLKIKQQINDEEFTSHYN